MRATESTTGWPSSDAIRCVRRGGRVVYVGMGKAVAAVPHAEILKREATVCGLRARASEDDRELPGYKIRLDNKPKHDRVQH